MSLSPTAAPRARPSRRSQLATELNAPVVLKSQVLSGGRMKAGGVKFADTPEEAASAAAEILKLPIRDQLPVCVSVEAKAAVAKEYYLGVTYDALAKKPVMIFSDMGGIDIEQVAEEHPDHVAKHHFSTLVPLHGLPREGADRFARHHRRRADGAHRHRRRGSCGCSSSTT